MGEPASKPHVLLVDDDESIAELYKRALKKNGYKVRHADNGNAALKAVEEQLPAIIICDVMMPLMDGFSFLKRLRTDQRFALTPVLLLTALNGEADKANGYRFGADGYLVKPIKPLKLVEEVESVLHRHSNPDLLGEGPPFGGDLSTVGLGALLMALSTEMRTGLLKLDTGGLRGTVTMRGGVPIDAAAAGTADPMDALASMLGWRAGHFEFHPDDTSDASDNFGKPLAELISAAEARRSA